MGRLRLPLEPPFDAKGEFEVNFKTQERQNRKIVFQNAPVSAPIISSGKMIAANHSWQ